jgi:glycine/D-amino acid oxidase-like deaminating enzyme
VQPGGGAFSVRTSHGEISARKVAVATNGYSFDLISWLQRRIIPITAYMAASAPIAPALMARLFPSSRSLTTTDHNPTWIRSSPDRTRILFGGRTGYSEGSLARKADRMLADVAKVLPELRGHEVSHCWKGNMAFTFDGLPHIGEIQGIHYSAGYCGAGLAMGSWLGHRLGCKLVGDPVPRIALEDMEFPGRFYYRRRAWFVPFMIRGLNIRDKADRLSGAK